MKNIQAKCNSVILAFLRQHPSPSVLNLEPKCALDKFSICGNGCVGVHRPASWMDCQTRKYRKSPGLTHHKGKQKRTEDPSVGTQHVALQSVLPRQKPLLSSLYLRPNSQL